MSAPVNRLENASIPCFHQGVPLPISIQESGPHTAVARFGNRFLAGLFAAKMKKPCEGLAILSQVDNTVLIRLTERALDKDKTIDDVKALIPF